MKRSRRNLLVIILLAFPIIFASLTYLEDFAETSESTTKGVISFLAELPSRVIDLAAVSGYAGVFTLMLLEAAAFPIPSEIVLPFAGYLVSRGSMEFWQVVAFSTIAAMIGSFIDYYIGSRLGRYIFVSPSRLPFVNAEHLKKVESWFNTHGSIAVAIFRLVPAARVLISFPAGAYKMNKFKFAVYTLAGCLPWNILLVYLGFVLGSSWENVVEAFRYINLIVYALIILFIVWIIWRLKPQTTRKHL